MPDYHLFGDRFRSEIEFPELVPVVDGSPPRWSLACSSVAPKLDGGSALGTEEVEKGISVSLFAVSSGLRLVFDDTGVFEVSQDGLCISWMSPVKPDLDAVRKDVLGRVFAVALQQEGMMVLHGSSVAIGSVAVAFLAPKFHGKSTTATALVNAGGRLLADDLVPVTPGDRPMVLPSIPVVQLWKDSAEKVGSGVARLDDNPNSPKVQIGWPQVNPIETHPVPLAGIYLLAPVTSKPEATVKRTPLSGAQAALGLLGQSKVGALLGVERRATLLQQLADLAERVPVFRLEIPRDFDRIGELTTSLLEWHLPDPVPGANAGLS